MTRPMQHEVAFDQLRVLLCTGAQVFRFPTGLCGLPTCHTFALSRYQPEDGSPSPFYVLEEQRGDLSFFLISPFSIVKEYPLEIPPALLTVLLAQESSELVSLAIVTLRARLEEASVNLQGPLVINPQSRLGLQAITENYPLRFPLVQNQDQTLV